MRARLAAYVGAAAFLGFPAAGISQSSSAAPSVELLADIVGTWQSDTTNGTSAVSSCAWTPQHGAVLCEQTVTTPAGARHALNLFTFDRTAEKFVFYVLGQPGDPMRPVPLAIDGHVWIYGGQARDASGNFSRTVNDFTAKDSYSWRLESSADGERWTSGAHGMSRRVR
jgi:hypothetical protein